MRVRLTALIVATAIVAAFASPAQAAPVFSAQVRNDDNGSNTFVSAAVPVDTLDVMFTSNLGIPQFIGRGAASGGQVQARGDNQSINVGGFSNFLSAETRANMTLDDLQITGPAGVISVQASLNFRVDGAMGTVGAEPNANAAAGSVTLQVQVPGIFLQGQKTFLGNNLDSASGIFAGILGSDIHGDFTTPLFNLATLNNPFPNNLVQFGLVTGTGAGNGTSAFSNFFDGGGVHFAAGGPVFNLPDGFTANSISGNIVDNHWIGVPEPASVLLGLIGAAGLALFAIRRKSRQLTGSSGFCSQLAS
jgi:hypothetical protein